MSQQRRTFTKRQTQTIIKIVFLESMLIVFILPSLQSTGEIPAASCTPPCLTRIQGPTVATVTVASGSTTGSIGVTFSPSFSSNPTLSIVPQIFTSSGIPSPTFTTTTYTPYFFQSGTTLTWTNMPAVDTEIYGDPVGDHRLTLTLVGTTSFRFGYNCPLNSNTIGAYLTLQYSLDSGTTWTELSSSQRAIIDGTACPNGSGFGSSTFTAIPTPAQTATTLLRILGHGGGGVGDVPKFSELWIEIATTIVSPTNNIYQWRACQTAFTCTTQPSASTTGFFIIINLAYPVASSISFRFTWYAGLPV